MTERKDILANGRGWRRLSYTRRCGWIDWGHARPESARALKGQMDQEEANSTSLKRLDIRLEGKPAFVVVYGQEMGGMGIKVSTVAHWVVRKGLSPQQKESAALGIFMAASRTFEHMQASFPFSLATNSGFSGEDLVSNLIGFYGAYRNIGEARLRDICGDTGEKESLRIWDEYLPKGIGAVKNRSFRPILFPTTEGVSSPSDTSFPLMFSTIRPSPSGRDWVAIKNRFIDNTIINRRAPIDVSARGEVTLGRVEQAQLRNYAR
ncbi:hypothetical protein RRU01S_19_01310 [Agrobacterium rubi TR3 = NBRC 13261]|uniref:Uncharacterized protein n=1 Tax=Agrobacterium rubi TR3 = NBRC 13261 TaxID=1368415 RepID=A0A081CYI0_9HYPH|nr:hypothetical protein [Agrobacterium rubi]MBP1879949.1 hypothetical protein [Agrobacterium rubi]GAK71726.1 hypothetical protein RRU01S_19_01310 [Agrobacterium rubi TR3 = NBRC 13261]